MHQLFEVMAKALDEEIKLQKNDSFQKGVERGRLEERVDARKELVECEKERQALVAERDQFKNVPSKHSVLLKRAFEFVCKQERLNHAASCPGRRGWGSLCGCGGGARMGDFFDIMGDLCCAVEEIEAQEKKQAPKPEAKKFAPEPDHLPPDRWGYESCKNGVRYERGVAGCTRPAGHTTGRCEFLDGNTFYPGL